MPKSLKQTSNGSNGSGATLTAEADFDFLEKRIAELEVQNSYLQSASFLKNAVDTGWASIEFKPDGTILDVNDNWVHTLGYKKEEMIGKHHRIFCDEKYVASDEYKQFWEKLANGEVNSGEFKRVKNGGEELWINASYTPVKDDSGKVTKVIKIASDITDMIQGRFEGEAIKSAVNTGWASIEFSPDGFISSVNDNWIKTLGYTKEEMVGQHHRMFCETEYANSSEYKQFWSDLSNGIIKDGEFKRLKKGGEEFWINASYTPIRDSSGVVYKVIKIANDITAQKIRNADFEGQIDAVSKAQAVIEFNLDGTAITANDNFLNTVGYTLDEVCGNHHRMFCDRAYASSDEYKEFWQKLNNGEYITGEFKRVTKTGETLWLQATYNPILDFNGKPYKVVKFATDITAQKLAIEELNRVVVSVLEEGKLTERANYGTAKGAELDLLRSINELLDGISAPILEVSEVISSMAEGDLTQSVNVECKGDVKKMAEGLAIAMENLNELLGAINESSNLIASSSEQMLVKSDQMRGTTEQVASAIGQMAEGVVDQTAQIDESSKLIENVRSSAEEMGIRSEGINAAAKKGQDNAKRGLNTVKKVVTSMTAIQDSAGVTSESIEVLTKRSEEIARTLNVITDIAGQTNLLALNAAIEAARAGDAGRGFAVVAEEIRKLAEDSRSSAGDIEKVIKAVEKDINSAGKAINEMGESVKSGNEASKEAETVFMEIDDSVVETLRLSEEVLKSTQTQRSSIDETVKNIEKIVVVSEETSSGTEEIATSSKDLSNGMIEFNSSSKGLNEIANQLREGVSKFKLRRF